MQYSNDIATVQDTSTQAMTEVALGLSMAFFALLIIALMSVTLPTSGNDLKEVSEVADTTKVDISEQVNLSINTSKGHQSDAKSTTESGEVILLYWHGQFFDTQQQLLSIENVAKLQDVIVAVNPQIPFNQLIDIQTQLAGKSLRLTQLDEQWQQVLGENSATKYSSGQ